MSTLINGDKRTQTFEINKQNNTKVTLSTSKKYVDKDIELTFNVQSATYAANTASANATLVSTDSTSLNGINIFNTLSTVSSEPSNGYFFMIKADGSGSSKITKAGWIDAKALTTASTSINKYFSIRTAKATVAASGSMPGLSVNQVNAQITNKTRIITAGPQTSNSFTDPFYIALQTKQAENTITLTKKDLTTGYLGNLNDITANNLTLAEQTSTYYIPVKKASFVSSVSNDSNYSNISETAPVLTSGSYLYINEGYIQNSKISLAKLVPDSSNIAANYILANHSAYNNDGTLITGTIESKAANTYYPSTSDQTIVAGVYLSGDQIFKGVTTSNITAANVKSGTTISVGYDGNSNIANVTGTFTAANTVSSGQTAAQAAQIRKNYSAWVNGAEVKGSMVDVNPGFSGGGLTGTTAAAVGTNVTLGTSDTSGIKIQTSGTAGRTAITYDNAYVGYLNKSKGTQAVATLSSTTWNGNAYYLTSVSLPKDKKFTISTQADTTLDTTSDLTITNATFRRVVMTNSGTTLITSGSSTAGNIQVKAYNNASTPALTDYQTVVENGKWKYTTITPNSSTQGPYYGAVIVKPISDSTVKAAGSVTNTKGKGICTYSNSKSTNITVSDTDTSGISVVFTGSGQVTSKAAITTAGYAPTNMSFTNNEQTTTSNEIDGKKYITGVNLTKGKTFSITVPNGNATDTVTFKFTVTDDNNYDVFIEGLE